MNVKRPLLLVLLTISSLVHLHAQCRQTLIWSDEFNGTALDLTKWSYDIGNGCPALCGWGNGEMEYYTNLPQNVSVGGGNLVITAVSNPNYLGSGSNFTSGKIVTRNAPLSWTYGRFEARIRLPRGNGLWPAFWMLPMNNAWPTTGEIDIMEARGDNGSRISSALHYGNNWPNNQNDGLYYDLPTGNFYDNFHVFSAEWSPAAIRFYMDNILYSVELANPNSLTPANNNANQWPWNTPFYLILNLAVGGWYTGVTNPALVQLTKPTLEVDYVRVYSMQDELPYLGITPTLPGRVEAENYDHGCQDIAYYDVDPNNNGNVAPINNTFRRPEAVDIQPTGDVGGGFNVGWINNGEWLGYSVTATQSATYNLTLRVATPNAGGSAYVEVDGVNVTGLIPIPSTGGWNNWANVNVVTSAISAGAHQIRVVFPTGGFNFNYFNTTVNTALPVSLIYFKASAEEQDALITWATASEQNNSRFDLEKSIDGKQWEVRYSVKGETNSSEIKEYAYRCSSITNTTYFRLVQVDEDGKRAYSEILVVHPPRLETAVFPNPMENELTIQYSTIPDELSITNLMGIKMPLPLAKTLPERQLTMDTHAWEKGVYLIKITSGEHQETLKLLK